MLDLDPALRHKTEALLSSSDRLRGIDYLHSPQRTKVSQELTRALLPFAIVATAIGKAAVRTVDGSANIFYHHPIYHPFYGEETIVKIKTLCDDASEKELLMVRAGADVRSLKHENDAHPLATRAGRWLRKLGIDEAPQILFNVVQGKQLTLIGPRPRSMKEWDRDIAPFQHTEPLRTWINQMACTARIPYGWLSPYVHLGRSGLSLNEQAVIESAYIENASETVDRRIVGRLIGLFFKRNGK